MLIGLVNVFVILGYIIIICEGAVIGFKGVFDLRDYLIRLGCSFLRYLYFRYLRVIEFVKFFLFIIYFEFCLFY